MDDVTLHNEVAVDTTDNSMGVMLALLPTTSDWCTINLPHMTLVYAGLVQDMKESDHNDMAKTALSLAMVSPPVVTDVLATDLFGEENDIDVLLLRPTPQLLAMRAQVESWNMSQFPFRPHVTVGPRGSFSIIPKEIIFDSILVQWGMESLVFKFASCM